MSRSRLLAVFITITILLAGVLGCLVDDQPPGADNESTALSISGSVVDINGTGVPGITVSLNGYSISSGTPDTLEVERDTLTGDDGDFEFTNVKSGVYSITASAEDFVMTPAFLTAVVEETDLEGLAFNAGKVSPDDEADEYILLGGVTDEAGLPLTGVLVTVTDEAGAEITQVMTDGDGLFDLILPGTGTYIVMISHDDYLFTEPSRTFTIDESGQSATGVFTGVAIDGRPADDDEFLGSVSVVCVDESGTAIAGVRIDVSSEAINMIGETGDDGSIEFTGLPAGTYTITVSHDDYEFDPASFSVDVNDAEPLLVTATGIRDQDEPTVKISGKVLDDESDGFRDVTVTATNAAGEVREAVTQSNGRYEIDVTPGEWVVRAMYPDWTFSPESITVTATNGAVNLNNILGISETAEPEFSVTGSVIEESGIGVFDATVTLDLPAGKLTEKTDAFGGYRFSDLTAGSYTISVKVPGTTVEPSEYAFTVVDSDVTIPPFVVTEIIPQGQGKIRGEVIDTTDTGIQNVLLTFTSPGHPAYTLFTDRKGAFMVTLPEGTWTVIPIGAGYTFNPETISVTVTNGVTDIDPFIGHTEQDVTAFTISGTVLDDKGHGMNRATVTLSGPDGTSTQRTNSKGEYSFENSVPGGYTLTVTVSGSTFTPPEISITVTDADVTVDAFVGAEEIVEEREGKIDGAVVDALGNGLADITLTLTREGFDTVTETTGNNGKYSARVQQGEWLLAPSGGGYSFSQETVTVVVGEGTTTVPDIIATSTGQKATIAGTVVDDKDKGIRDITVILAGPDGSQTVTTDNKGEYAFVGVSPGTYIVSVAGEGWTFAPESREVTVNDISLALDPFVGTEETDNSGGDNNGGNDNNNGGGNDNNNGGGSSEGRLTGTVRTSAGEDVEGVSIVMSSSDYGTVQTTTSKQGKFDAKVTEGVWTVTPSLTGYTFSPLQLTVTVGQTASTADFTAIPENTGESVYQVSGRVIDEDGDGMKNASVTLSGGFSADVKTGTDGTFTISAVPNGTYILTVSVSGRTSDPETQTVVVNGADVIAETVTARKKNAN